MSKVINEKNRLHDAIKVFDLIILATKFQFACAQNRWFTMTTVESTTYFIKESRKFWSWRWLWVSSYVDQKPISVFPISETGDEKQSFSNFTHRKGVMRTTFSLVLEKKATDCGTLKYKEHTLIAMLPLPSSSAFADVTTISIHTCPLVFTWIVKTLVYI
jgi:hypothetical protein